MDYKNLSDLSLPVLSNVTNYTHGFKTLSYFLPMAGIFNDDGIRVDDDDMHERYAFISSLFCEEIVQMNIKM